VIDEIRQNSGIEVVGLRDGDMLFQFGSRSASRGSRILWARTFLLPCRRSGRGAGCSSSCDPDFMDVANGDVLFGDADKRELAGNEVLNERDPHPFASLAEMKRSPWGMSQKSLRPGESCDWSTPSVLITLCRFWEQLLFAGPD